MTDEQIPTPPAEPSGEKPTIGRPTKWTQELQDLVCENIMAGNFDNVSAEAAGLRYATFKDWMQRGEGADPTRKPKEPFVSFAAAVRKARNEAQARLVQIIANSAITRSDDAKWLLERRWPKEWGSKSEMTLKGASDGPIKIGLSFERTIIERDPETGEARTVIDNAPTPVAPTRTVPDAGA